jgi:pSer/pThr/pTyr-binding forkhead associated (FHA) protein
VIICPNCSRENEDHYKFCLGCGTELSKVARADAPTALPHPARPAAPPVVVARPAPAPVLAPPVAPVRPAVVSAPPAAPAVSTPPRASEPDVTPAPPALAPTPAPVDLPPEAAEPTVTVAASEVSAALEAGRAPADAGDLPFELSMDGETALPDLVGTAAAAVVDAVEVPETTPATPALPPPADPMENDPADLVSTGQMESPTLRESAGMADAVVAALEQGIPPEPTAGGSHGSAVAVDPRLCGQCGAAVPEGFKFCGVCGSRYESRQRPAGQVFVPNVQDVSQAPARLIVIHPDGTEGDVFPLGGTETTVGRSHPSAIFSEDPFLSPRHATFYFVKGQLFARDEGSLNGIFVRIKAEVELFHGDMFRIGQQLLRFEEMAQVRPVLPGAGDGTTVMGSPVRGAWGRLASVVAINTPAAVWVLRRPEEHMGRERGELTFPDDGFVSGTHCKVTTRDGRFFLRDLDSTNGTYLRVKAEGILAQNDLILLGQQLFKIDLSH